MKTNDVVYIKEIDCWFHERCKPAHTPAVTRTVDMNDVENIGNMPFATCSVCGKKLILGNGRIAMRIKAYSSFDLNSVQFDEVEQMARDFTGKRITNRHGRFYDVLHCFLQTNPADTRQAAIIAVCEPVEDEELHQKAYKLTYALRLVRAELELSHDPKQAITEALAIIKSVEA